MTVRRPLLALGAAVLAVGVLTGCGGDDAMSSTTCGELTAISVDERVALLTEIAEQARDDGVEEVSQFLDASDDDQRTVAEAAPDALCADVDDDTTLADLEPF
ncbi:MAG: hypothetical protein CMH83_03310 [Nocardioides sp.]|nr:hypothetical protein [Nocardioides sp.]